MTTMPEYLNSDSEELNETRFHLIIKFEDDLFKIFVDTEVKNSCWQRTTGKNSKFKLFDSLN